jgi:diguanylate cyclase (GGDEF)-like protein
MDEGYKAGGSGEELVKGIQDLKGKWQSLKESLIEYRSNQSGHIREQIILKSEICWKTADAAVLIAQIATEDKIGGIKLFYIIILLNFLNSLIAIWLVYVYVRKKLEYQASYDSVTRLLNRYSYENEIEKEISRCKRYNRNMSLVLFDIDHFKDINDRHGHKRGDQVLSKLAKLVEKSVRKSDLVFRIGGEEFAIIIPETEADGASRMAEKIRREVENSSFQPVKQVTISLGVAELPGNTTHADLFRHADKALYQAKHSGRNRVKIFVDDIRDS